MKKVILSAILLTGSVTFANAHIASQPLTDSTEQAVTADEYKTVTLDELSAEIQSAVKNLAGDAYEVSKVEFDAANGQTKVTLTDKTGQSEKSVVLDKNGNVMNPTDVSEVGSVQTPPFE